MHYLQHRNLLKKWEEDFPALHTEGGQPGSANAGIVAFIRERLVDLDEEKTHATPTDPEARVIPDGVAGPEWDAEHSRIGAGRLDFDLSNGDGFQLKEIPPMNVDLGMAKYLTTV